MVVGGGREMGDGKCARAHGTPPEQRKLPGLHLRLLQIEHGLLPQVVDGRGGVHGAGEAQLLGRVRVGPERGEGGVGEEDGIHLPRDPVRGVLCCVCVCVRVRVCVCVCMCVVVCTVMDEDG